MSKRCEFIIAYFISITHCPRDQAIQLLEETDWKLDLSLNLFFEQDHNEDKPDIHSKCIDPPYQQSSHSQTIIIPTMIQFQRFIESFDVNTTNLLENSSKMMHLAMKYATCKQVNNIPSNEREHWHIHLKVDYTRLQTLLDNDMCAPLVWIEHFEHLLDGKICQLFDCDYMFQTID